MKKFCEKKWVPNWRKLANCSPRQSIRDVQRQLFEWRLLCSVDGRRCVTESAIRDGYASQREDGKYFWNTTRFRSFARKQRRVTAPVVVEGVLPPLLVPKEPEADDPSQPWLRMDMR